MQREVSPAFPLVFALAGRSARKNGAEVIAFWEDRLECLHRGEIVLRLSWSELDSLAFIQGRSSGGMATFLLGSLGRKVEDAWHFTSADRSWQLELELDSKFRQIELRFLFQLLYKKVPDFEEKSLRGESLYLLEPLSREEIARRKTNGIE